MEKIAWLFNGDFEENLFAGKFQKKVSSKANQEFEYFIHFSDPQKIIFSQKKYSEDYQDYIATLTEVSFETTMKAKQIKNWCQGFENAKELQAWQSKTNLFKFLKEKGHDLDSSDLIDNDQGLEEGFVYKASHSMSGGGHYLYPLHEAKIKKTFKEGFSLLKEPIRNRVLDFSTLIDNGKVICRYENYIDNYFQYKGSTLKESFELPSHLEEQYQKTLEDILVYTKNYQGSFSIDSYLYQKENEIKLYPACEINMRKTMGYIAHLILEKYFSDKKSLKFILMREPLRIKNYDLCKKFYVEGKSLMLSPIENRFKVFAIAGNNDLEIKENEKELLFTFF